ncbi:hypothetical protein [Sanguibacter sp. 25GB23B1]|uniref:hypothetical protein n=1 Tax=unclassified Sanguibacter TaxID=2645534 RepID=UPI0032AF60F0
MTNLTEALAQSVSSWGVRLTYGEKGTLGGQEIIPVALACFGFGGGEGAGITPDDGEPAPGRSEGSGGGGGGFAVPIGAYIAGPAGPVFHPNPVALVAVTVPLVSALGMAVAQIVRATRGRTAH